MQGPPCTQDTEGAVGLLPDHATCIYHYPGSAVWELNEFHLEKQFLFSISRPKRVCCKAEEHRSRCCVEQRCRSNSASEALFLSQLNVHPSASGLLSVFYRWSLWIHVHSHHLSALHLELSGEESHIWAILNSPCSSLTVEQFAGGLGIVRAGDIKESSTWTLICFQRRASIICGHTLPQLHESSVHLLFIHGLLCCGYMVRCMRT